jgi:hypothetical protein
MQAHDLPLARKYSERPEHVHDGKMIVTRSNLRWCSDGFEFTCWNGDIVRGAFIIEAHDREIIAWRAVVMHEWTDWHTCIAAPGTAASGWAWAGGCTSARRPGARLVPAPRE